MFRLIFSLVTVLLIVLGCAPQDSKKKQNPLIGSWNVEEIYWKTPDTTYAIKNAQPGIFMVTETRYSMMWTPTQYSRIPFKKLAYPTDEEILTGFRSIVFNSGTYTMTDSMFHIKATIAKVPGFEGGTQSFKYKLYGDGLELNMIDETYPNGDKPDWYGHVETTFKLSKID